MRRARAARTASPAATADTPATASGSSLRAPVRGRMPSMASAPPAAGTLVGVDPGRVVVGGGSADAGWIVLGSGTPGWQVLPEAGSPGSANWGGSANAFLLKSS